MVFQFIRSIVEGRDDAKAAIAEPKFQTTMDLVEKLPQLSQETVALGIEHVLMGRLAEGTRKHLPAHCQQEKDYLQFVDSKGLQVLAEDYFAGARRVMLNQDSAPERTVISGVAGLELVGYYLLARSWQDFDHTINIDAPGLGATMIGHRIETRIHAFLKKYGRSLPRSC